MPDQVPGFQLTLGAPGSGTRNTERGWCLFDPMQESYGRADYAYWTWGAMGLYPLPAGLHDALSTRYVQELGAVICRPYPRFWDAIPLSYWGPIGSGGSTWEELAGYGIGNIASTWYHQYDAGLATENGLYYAWPAPPQPAFGVAVARWDLPPDWNFSGVDAWTRIIWGGGQFELLIPYNRPAMLYDASRNLLMEMPLGIAGAQPPGWGVSQFFAVWVMHLKGRVLISFDMLKTFWVYGRGDKTENAITTTAGQIQVSNVGSRWMFAFMPIDFPSSGRFRSRIFDKGYDASNEVAGGGAGGEAADYMYNSWPGRASPGITIAEVSLGTARYCQYQATLAPARYAAGATYFGHTPELYAVRLKNLPVTAAGPTGNADTIAASDVLEIDIEHAEDMEISRCTLLLNNDGSRGYEELREYGAVDVNLKAHDSDDWYDAFDGFVYQVEPEQDEGGGKFVRVLCAGLWLPFEDVKCTEADPVMSGWTVGDAITWACLRCGVDFTAGDYDTDTALPLGLDGVRTWQPEPGRSWGDFLKSVAAYEQKFLWFDGPTLRYDPDPDENTITWHFKAATTVAGAPAGAIAMLGSLAAPRDPTDHRNEVRVIGRDVDGKWIIATKKDASNLDSVGWEKMILLQDPAYDTQERVNLVAATLFGRVSRFPPRRVHFRVRGNPAIKRRQVIKLWGGSSKVDRQVFRITAVRHAWSRETGPQFFTEAEAIWIRDDA